MKIFVTGSTGFLGRNLCQLLKKHHHKIYTYSGDIRNSKELRYEIQNFLPDVVIHLAAMVDLSRDYSISKRCFDINILGTLNLLQSLEHNHLKKLYLMSTEEVYGEGDLPFTESQQVFPPSFYAVSKLSSEHFGRIYAGIIPTDVIVFRLATMYGPFESEKRLIGTIITHAIKDKTIKLNSGMKKRDYVFVGDVVDAFMISLQKKQSDNFELYNIGGGRSYSLREFVDSVIRLTKSKSVIEYNAYPDRMGEANEWRMDISKANNEFQWKPRTNLTQGIKATIAYHLSHATIHE